MAKQSKIRQAAGTIIFMIILTSISVFIVATAFHATKATIEYNKALRVRQAILTVSGISLPEDDKAVGKLFDENITALKRDDKIVYYTVKDSGFVFNIEGAGLWGTIHAVVGINRQLNAITGIFFTEQQETPGLGGRIDEPWFKEQFSGKTPPLSMVPEKSKADANQFDAITGATITSTAVKDMVNRIMSEAPGIVKGAIK
ncbi:MAG: FMN-binding protein [Victivallaceae bacterium]|nr:FMN-binding protein [Victivallaceae bacterium]